MQVKNTFSNEICTTYTKLLTLTVRKITLNCLSGPHLGRSSLYQRYLYDSLDKLQKWNNFSLAIVRKKSFLESSQDKNHQLILRTVFKTWIVSNKHVISILGVLLWIGKSNLIFKTRLTKHVILQHFFLVVKLVKKIFLNFKHCNMHVSFFWK